MKKSNILSGFFLLFCYTHNVTHNKTNFHINWHAKLKESHKIYICQMVSEIKCIYNFTNDCMHMMMTFLHSFTQCIRLTQQDRVHSYTSREDDCWPQIIIKLLWTIFPLSFLLSLMVVHFYFLHSMLFHVVSWDRIRIFNHFCVCEN